jgi:hypothetical protein
MKLPNWLRITWWILLTTGLTIFLLWRLTALVIGAGTPFDMVAFVVWICLVLAPVFTEVELLGFRLKQEIASVKQHVDKQVESLRADIHNSVDVRSHFSPQITFTTPPADAQLPELEKHLLETLEETLRSHGLTRQQQGSGTLPAVPQDNVYFFQVRYLIERELQRIWEAHFSGSSQRALLVTAVLPSLVKAELISPEVAKAIRDVYSVCSPAIHGREVSGAQRRFVQEVTPDLLRTLRAID